MAVAVGVEKDRVDVFGETIRCDRGLSTRPESAVATLNEETSRLPFGAAGVDVVAAVAVRVTHGERRPLGREEMGDQWLPLVVVERVLVMPEIEREALGHVREERRRRQRLARIVISALRVMLRQRQRPDMTERLALDFRHHEDAF